MSNHNTIFRASNLTFVFLAVALVIFILLLNTTPNGIVIFSSNDDDYNILSELSPRDRIVKENDIYKQSSDIVYFTTKMPFHFDKANVKITFQNNYPYQEIHIGFKDEADWHYNTKIFHSPKIDALDWPAVGDAPVLYQREKKFDNLEAFYKNPPQDAIIGTYNLEHDNLNKYVTLPDYKPSKTKTIIDTPLRGSHTIYVYLHGEPFQMTFYKQDLNWYKGEDNLNIKIYKEDDLVFEIEGKDDGIADASKDILPEQKVEVKNPSPDLPESGVYKVVIGASGDSIVKRIETNLSKIVFAESVFLTGNKDVYGDIIEETKPQIVYTDAALISALTYHGVGVQNIKVDNKLLRINQVQKEVATTSAQPISEIIVPKNDVILKGILGFFAFSKESFFVPFKFPVREIKNEGDILLVDYILTEYKKSKKVGEWYTAEATFDLSTAVMDKNKLSWIIRAPGLKENNREIIIKDTEVTLIKKPWRIFGEELRIKK